MPIVVDLNGVIAHEVHGHQGFDHLRVLAHPLCGAAHRGEIAKQWNAGEILEQHSRDDKRDLVGARRIGIPIDQLPYVVLRDLLAVTVAEHALEDDAHGDRQPRYPPGRHLLQRRKGMVFATDAGLRDKGAQRVKRIGSHPSSGLHRDR